MRVRLAAMFKFVILICVAIPCFAQNAQTDEAALNKTDAAVRAAFASGDLDTIRLYHHPDVVKSLSPGTFLSGRDAVVAAIAANLQSMHLEFTESKTESSLAMGDSAVRMFHFTIRATPKTGGAPSSFTGRAMVVYVRSKDSPTGWVTIRELVQPAS
jgi:ketosteroid isomerase-like protein